LFDVDLDYEVKTEAQTNPESSFKCFAIHPSTKLQIISGEWKSSVHRKGDPLD